MVFQLASLALKLPAEVAAQSRTTVRVIHILHSTWESGCDGIACPCPSVCVELLGGADKRPLARHGQRKSRFR